jgi:transposase InsO family protein
LKPPPAGRLRRAKILHQLHSTASNEGLLHVLQPRSPRSWHTDITYLPVGERGFLYLATVIDLHSRRLAGWAIADHMRTDLVLDALHGAQRTRGSLDGAIMHTDGANTRPRRSPPPAQLLECASR